MKPYIGVTGFMSRKEVDEVLGAIPAGTQRLLMIGVLVSSKTMYGIPNKFPKRYPSVFEIENIFPKHRLALNLIHFNANDPEELLVQMIRLTDFGGDNLHGFQLNMVWPEPRILAAYKEGFPEKKLVLQCSEAALEAHDFNPEEVAQHLTKYEGICDYVLLDQSGGKGRVLNPYRSLEFLNHFSDTLKEMSLVLAGGLGPENVDDLIGYVAKMHPNISIDAERNVRDKSDNLDVPRAKEFISRAYKLFDKYEK